MAALKGFISFAHEDFTVAHEFRVHLRSMERAFGIAFWTDEKIRSGQHWDSTIQRAITAAEVVIMLVSPAYLASDYIHGHEYPAIQAQAHSGALICPVILSRCNWQPVFGSLQAVPTVSGRIRPIVEWRPQANGFDRAREQIQAAVERHFKIDRPSLDWRHRIAGLEQDRVGTLWKEQDGQLASDPAGDDADKIAAGDPTTRQLHDVIKREADAFTGKVAGLGNAFGWEDLPSAAQRLAVVIACSTDELPARIAQVWEAAIGLASFLDQDRRVRQYRDRRVQQQDESADIDPLPPDRERLLSDLIRTLAPWVRRFPTARQLDEEAGGFLTRKELLAPAKSIINVANQEELVRSSDAADVQALLKAAERGEFQGTKAAARGTRGALNLVYLSGSLLAAHLLGVDGQAAGFVLGAISSAYAAESQLIKRIGAFLARAEKQIPALLPDLPDLRHAFASLITVSKGGLPPDVMPAPTKPPIDASHDLLTAIIPDLRDSDRWGSIAKGWPLILRQRRAFRVRGFTWFKVDVEANISSLEPFIGRMEIELRQRPGWNGLPWPWNERFAVSQLFSAARGDPIRFDKAAKVLLICELAAADRGLPTSRVYQVMRIEPAIFVLSGFDANYLQRVELDRPDLIEHVVAALGQPHNVIRRMAAGETVSYRLAYRMRQVLLEAVPNHSPGQVMIGQAHTNRTTCVEEIVDGLSDPEVF